MMLPFSIIGGGLRRFLHALDELHDHEPARAAGVLRATVDRVVVLGFEVRVELTSAATGAPFTAQITRGDAEALRLSEGDTVYVRPTRAPPIAGVAQVPGSEPLTPAG